MTGRSLRLAALVAAVSMVLVPALQSGAGAGRRLSPRDADRALAGALASFAVGDPATGTRVPSAATPPAPAPISPADKDSGKRSARPHVLVRIPGDTLMSARPGEGRTVGIVPAGSKYYATPTTAWIQEISEDGDFGRLSVPYSGGRRSGWIELDGLARRRTHVEVQADLSDHRLVVVRRDRVVLRTRMATGAAASPTPPGSYFVTDHVPFPGGGYLGSFAFGISGIQPSLPPGWSGGNQLAIHGTNNPSSIGRSASAGCLRVSESALARLRPLLELGTPVVIHR